MSHKLICSVLFLFITVSSSWADILTLSNGETLDVSIVDRTSKSVHVIHPILGELHIATENIQSIEESATRGVVGSPKEEGAPELQNDEPAWNQTIKLGAGYQAGQTNNVDISTSYHADKTVNEHETVFDLSYRFAKTDSTRNANRFSGAWGNKWFQSDSKWDFFTNVQFDWAEFQSWDQRILGDLGVGYEIYNLENEKETIKLTSRFGSGIRKEFQSENDSVIPEGLLGLALDWRLQNDQTLIADTTWFPDFENFSNYRIVTKASWNIKIDKANNLDFSIGVHHEYDSVVDVDVNNTYLHLTAGISYSF